MYPALLYTVKAMPGWKDISDSAEKKRAAAFEAQTLAVLAKDKAAPSVKPVVAVPPSPAVPAREGIQIAVTADGQTAQYQNLDAVPLAVRQQILKAWQPAAPPLIHADPPVPPGPRSRSRRVAMTLNLFWPGAGQIYLGRPVIGAVYALGFGACFVAMMVIFVRGYGGYLQTSTAGDIFGAGNLENLAQSFHPVVLGVLSVTSVVIYLASAIHLTQSRSV